MSELISIIIPAYNAEKSIQQTLKDLNIKDLVEEVDYLSEIDSRRYSLDIKELKNALTLRHS